MAASDAPCFGRDDMSAGARRSRDKADRSKARRGAPPRPRVLGPTPERMAKGDVSSNASGGYRAPPPIERLRDRRKLDPADPYTNEALYRAAEKLANVFHGAGLSAGAQAQDLNRVVSRGGDAPSGMPLNEHAMAQRQQLRAAVQAMGWWSAFPHRGAARLVLDVVCFELGVEDATRAHRPGLGSDARIATGMDVLREGLFALAVHWRLLRA